jgi:nucleoside-diphosphate-sugar epimerase
MYFPTLHLLILLLVPLTVVRGVSVLILGGNGNMGAETVLTLLDNGIDVTILNRGTRYWDSNQRIFEHPAIKWYQHNRNNITVPQELAPSYDVLLDFSGTKPEYVSNAISSLASRIRTLWVYISTDSVYEVCGSGPNTLGLHPESGLSEEEALRPIDVNQRKLLSEQDEYGNKKLLGEEILQSMLKRLGLPFVSLRLPDVVGPRDNSRRSFVTSLYLRIVTDLDYGLPNIMPVDKQRKMSLVYSLDVAALCWSMVRRVMHVQSDRTALRIAHPRMVDRAFNVAFQEQITPNEVLGHWAPENLVEAAKNIKHYHKTDRQGNGQEGEEGDESEIVVPVMYTGVYPSVTRGALDVTEVLAEFRNEWSPTALDEALLSTDEFYISIMFRGLVRGEITFKKEIQHVLQDLAEILFIGAENWQSILEWFHRHMEDKHPDAQSEIEHQISTLATLLPKDQENTSAKIPLFDQLKKEQVDTLNGIPLAFVKRINAKDLTRQQFLDEYFDTNQPIIIENATTHWDSVQMTPMEIAHSCFRRGKGRGSVSQTTRKSSATIDKNKWGNLHRVTAANQWDLVSFFQYMDRREDFLNDLVQSGRTSQDVLLDSTLSAYLTNIPICERCPSLFRKTSALKYWNSNIVDVLMSTDEVDDDDAPSTPSLTTNLDCGAVSVYAYVGGRGTGTGMHQDLHGVTFWMTVLSGAKELVLFAPEEYQKLIKAEHISSCNDDGYCFNLNGRNLPDIFDSTVHQRHPRLHEATAQLATLHPGDALFGPANWFHQARNVEKFTFGVTGNFMHPRYRSLIRHMRNMCSRIAINQSLEIKSLTENLEQCQQVLQEMENRAEVVGATNNLVYISSKSAWWELLKLTDEDMKLCFSSLPPALEEEKNWTTFFQYHKQEDGEANKWKECVEKSRLSENVVTSKEEL